MAELTPRSRHSGSLNEDLKSIAASLQPSPSPDPVIPRNDSLQDVNVRGKERQSTIVEGGESELSKSLLNHAMQDS